MQSNFGLLPILEQCQKLDHLVRLDERTGNLIYFGKRGRVDRIEFSGTGTIIAQRTSGNSILKQILIVSVR